MSESSQSKKSLERRSGAYQPGDVIAGRYTVERMLGRGGMGIVYCVLDQETGERRALKTLLPKFLAHKKALQRFVREVNTIRQMNHKSVVKIFDFQKLDNVLFYTMEYVEGHSLRDYLMKRGKFGLGSTVRVLYLLCDALEHAHAYTIHRDLSPDNVMVLKDGSIKLLDFGLAKLLNTDAQLTMIGVNLGKFQYSSPEQRVNAAGVDKRADIYSLGVMFFELLTEEVPPEYEPVTAMRPDLPDSANRLLEKAMAPNPEDRFASAAELKRALMAVYEESKAGKPQAVVPKQAPARGERNVPIQTRPASWWKRFWARLTRWRPAFPKFRSR